MSHGSCSLRIHRILNIHASQLTFSSSAKYRPTVARGKTLFPPFLVLARAILEDETAREDVSVGRANSSGLSGEISIKTQRVFTGYDH